MGCNIIFVSWIGTNNDPYADARKTQPGAQPKPGVILETLGNIEQWVAHENPDLQDARVKKIYLLHLESHDILIDGKSGATRMLDAIETHLPNLRSRCEIIGVRISGNTHTPENHMREAYKHIWKIHEYNPHTHIAVSVSSGFPSMAQAWYLLFTHGLLPTPWCHVFYKFEGQKGHEVQAGLPEGQLLKPVEDCIDAVNELKNHVARRASPKISDSWNWKTAKSPRAKEVWEKLDKLFRSRRPILLRGERGIGKSYLARECRTFLQTHANLKDPPKFVAETCAAFLNNDLFNSKMFGHTKGAFTNATHPRNGLFKDADGGILFLDEIQDLGHDAQRQLMRALQEHEILPMGSDEPVKASPFLIAATNVENLETFMRPDFFDRIANALIELPPLRELQADFDSIWATIWKNEVKEYCSADLQEAIMQASKTQTNFHKRIVEAINHEARKSSGLPGNWRDLEKLATALIRNLPINAAEQTVANITSILESTLESWKVQLQVLTKNSKADHNFQLDGIVPTATSLAQALKTFTNQTASTKENILDAAAKEYKKNLVTACIEHFDTQKKAAEFLGCTEKTIGNTLKDAR
jgi:DNA-binding NtrC family response regulator